MEQNRNAENISAHQIVSHLGTIGAQYGSQSVAQWAAGETQRKVLIDVTRAASLWRVSVFGNVRLLVTWGTGATQRTEELRTPLVASFPGSVNIEAEPLSAQQTPVIASATLTPATGAGPSEMRQYIDASGGPVTFGPQVVRVVALTAAAVVVAGNVVNLAPGESLPVVAPAGLDSGQVLAELEP